MRLTPRTALASALLAAAPLAQAGDLDAFRAQHGDLWKTVVDQTSLETRMLYGASLAAPITPTSSSDYVRVARAHAGTAGELLGLDMRQLVLSRELFLPLGLVGSSDKVTVRFGQRFENVPVKDASVNVLMNTAGDLLSILDQSVSIDDGFETVPELSEAEATEFAWATFQAEDGGLPSYVEPLQLVIVGAGTRRDATLAWIVGVIVEENGIVTNGYRYAIAADKNGARVVGREAVVHQFDVSGQVFTSATPGLNPDSAGNPPTQQPLGHATVTSPQAGTTTTDADGFFNFAGVTGPIDVTVSYTGTYNDVDNFSGPELTSTSTISGAGNTVTINSSPGEQTTSQANAHLWINNLTEWIQSVNPADTIPIFVADSLVNIPPGVVQNIDACNAFWNGNSTNYFLSGVDGGATCVNTAFSSVIAHEMGHWLNARYGSGNGSDGFGEGNADVFAMFLTNNPIVGDGFFTSGGNIRTGTNNRQYCGDGNGGCYGAVHRDGEVHMGAMWKSRVALQNTNGSQAGGDIADALFLGWMNAFDQGTIDSIVQIQLLILDDDDGNSSNGTPHAADILSGFSQQGYPGLGVEISNVTILADTLDEAGPYGVVADLSPVFSPGILAASLNYTIDGIPQFPRAMSNFGGDTWGATIPGIPSPALVGYSITATNVLGTSSTFPMGNGAELSFRIGDRELLYGENFDGATDNGWTHVEVATQDDWQRGTPAGASGTSQGISWSEPDTAVSGANVWGNDLGPQGFNGAYQADVVNFLLSPVIDLTGSTHVALSFQRWLTVEGSVFDQAQILVNGNVVWENPSTNLLDSSWRQTSVDIAAFADNNPSVQVEFRLQSDGGLQLGGWNIDDLVLESFMSSPTVCVPTAYGTGLAGSAGMPSLDTLGQPARTGNGDFAIAVKNALPGATILLGQGPNQVNLPVFGGSLLVNPTVIVPLTADVFGIAVRALPLPNDPGLVGLTRHMQAFIIDPAAPLGVSMTQGLSATICN